MIIAKCTVISVTDQNELLCKGKFGKTPDIKNLECVNCGVVFLGFIEHITTVDKSKLKVNLTALNSINQNQLWKEILL